LQSVSSENNTPLERSHETAAPHDGEAADLAAGILHSQLGADEVLIGIMRRHELAVEPCCTFMKGKKARPLQLWEGGSSLA
jgi:hypothetical protein